MFSSAQETHFANFRALIEVEANLVKAFFIRNCMKCPNLYRHSCFPTPHSSWGWEVNVSYKLKGLPWGFHEATVLSVFVKLSGADLWTSWSPDSRVQQSSSASVCFVRTQGLHKATVSRGFANPLTSLSKRLQKPLTKGLCKTSKGGALQNSSWLHKARRKWFHEPLRKKLCEGPKKVCQLALAGLLRLLLCNFYPVHQSLLKD